jgi:hypothetical protein
MIGIGVGIGIGFGGQGLSPAWLSAQAQAIFPGIVVGDYAQEDLVMSGADVESFPGRVGPTLTNAVAGRYGIGIWGGRQALLGRSGVTASLQGTLSAAPKTILFTTSLVPAASPGRYLIPATNASDQGCIQTNTDGSVGGVYALYTGGGWSHRVNGVVATTVTAGQGPLLIESVRATATVTNVHIGHSGVGACWNAPEGRRLYLSAEINDAQRAAWQAAVARYYRTAF